MRVSSILRKCPAQRSWPERNILSMLCIFARFRTSVSGILSCILWFSGDILCGSGLVSWGVSGTPSKSHMRRVVSTTALYTLSFVALVMPRRPHTVLFRRPKCRTSFSYAWVDVILVDNQISQLLTIGLICWGYQKFLWGRYERCV